MSGALRPMVAVDIEIDPHSDLVFLSDLCASARLILHHARSDLRRCEILHAQIYRESQP